MVALTWPFGGWAVRVFTGGTAFEPERAVLVLLAALAALYLLCDLLNQVLFARGLARLSLLAWLFGVPASALCLVFVEADDLLLRVSGSLVVGIAVVAAVQTMFCFLGRDGQNNKGPTARNLLWGSLP